MTTTEISAEEMANLLVARIQSRLSMRQNMPGDINETLALELECLRGAVRLEANMALGMCRDCHVQPAHGGLKVCLDCAVEAAEAIDAGCF